MRAFIKEPWHVQGEAASVEENLRFEDKDSSEKKRVCHGNRHNAIYGRWDEDFCFLQDVFACWYWKLLTAGGKILTLFFLLEANNKDLPR